MQATQTAPSREPALLANIPLAALLAGMAGLAATLWHCFTRQDNAAGIQYFLLMATGLAVAKLLNPSHRSAYPFFLFLLAYSGAVVLIMAVGADAGDDDLSYFIRSKKFAAGFLRGSGTIEFGEVTYVGYVYLLGYLQAANVALGGASMEASKLVNAASGGLISVLVYHLAELVYGDRRFARWAGAAAAVFPLVLYYSSLLYRDIVLSLLVLAAAYVWARLESRYRSRRAVRLSTAALLGVFLLFMFMVFHFRDLTVILFLLGLVAMGFASLEGRTKTLALILAVPVGMLALRFVRLPSHGMSTVMDVALLKMAMYAELTEQRASLSSLGARVVDMPMTLGWLPRMFYTLFFPIPPIVEIGPGNPIGAMGSLGSAINYFAVPFVALGAWYSRKIAAARVLFWPAFMMFVAIALTTINGRHKTQYLGMFIILAVAGWIRAGSRRWDILGWYCISIAGAAFTYGALKLLVG